MVALPSLVMRRRAGRSLKSAYRVRRKQWRRRMRRTFLIAFGVPFAVLFVLMTLVHGEPRVWVALLVGAWAGAGTIAWLSPPFYIERLETGRWGEEGTEKQLRKLRREGWVDVHDRTLNYGNL